MQVELDIFSGRKNPIWSLTTDQTAEVRQRLETLPDSPDTSPAIFSGLGYRGFLLTDITDDRVITVWRETVIIRRGSTRSAKTDRERELEHLLLQTAQSHLAPELFRSVQSQIDEAPDIDRQN